MSRFVFRSIALAAMALGVTASQSSAAMISVITLPASAAGAEQPLSDSAPLGVDIQRTQLVYDPLLLVGLQPGDKITGLTFRLEAGQTSLPAQTVTDYSIWLSRSQNAAGSLSTTFSNNRGADETLVRSGALTFAAGDFPGGPGPNPFGAMITFTTPYLYAGGPLLVEIAQTGFPFGGRHVDDSAFNFAGAQQLFGNGFGATTATFNESQAMVMQLQVQPVPEPASLALLSAGLLGLGARRRRSVV